ncbi:MAG: FKBP-type peptidyl-prolyl cis-trans isomerase [Bacteroidota bacterium]|nr:FKBP-type peptidyl-prolyl cis-trans isomerase [Bacteroidota bacterium]
MRKVLILAIAVIFFMGCDTQKQMKKAEMTTNEDSLSYAFGISIGENLKRDSIELNPVVLGKALAELNDGNASMTAEEANTMIQSFFEDKEKEKYQTTVEAGKKFLEDNAKKEGVKTTASGLQYKIIKEGTGATPKPSDKVTVNYEGTLIDGTKFDSSYDRGEPATFGVTQVIKGWTEALQMMTEGAEWQLFIPSDLAYGSRPAGQITPYSTLVFKVELISIEDNK